MIGCHPQLYGLAEINLFISERVAGLSRLSRNRPRIAHGLLRSIADLAFKEQTETTIEAARLWLADNSDMSTADMFRLLGEMAGDRGLVDKSPFHVFLPDALKRIGKSAPDARFLHLTRHPADTLKSLFQIRHDLKEDGEQFVALDEDRMNAETADRLWLKPHLTIVEFLETIEPERQIRMRGEDLLADPRSSMRQIAEWMGIDAGDEAVEAMLHPERSPFAGFGPKNARYGTDPNFMEKPALRPYTPKDQPIDVWMTPTGQEVAFSDMLRSRAMTFGY